MESTLLMHNIQDFFSAKHHQPEGTQPENEKYLKTVSLAMKDMDEIIVLSSSHDKTVLEKQTFFALSKRN